MNHPSGGIYATACLSYTAPMSFLLDLLPLWGVFVLTTLVVSLSFELGFRVANFMQRKQLAAGHELTSAGAASVASSTLALVAFVLAFTFGVAAERFNERRVLVVQEANAISTTYMRLDFLPDDKARKEVQSLIRQYLKLRIQNANTRKDVERLVNTAISLQGQIWTRTTTEVKSHLDSDVGALLIDSMNEMFDLQSERLVAFRARLPSTVWDALFLMLLVGLTATGYQCGLSRSRELPVTAMLVVAFGITIMLIADLDRPMSGSLRVSRQPLIDLDTQLSQQTEPATQGK